jgi:hypothetical protein
LNNLNLNGKAKVGGRSGNKILGAVGKKWRARDGGGRHYEQKRVNKRK